MESAYLYIILRMNELFLRVYRGLSQTQKKEQSGSPGLR